ncbi:twin-arginine translocase TatA/TatE family subunit [Bradymonas sediminis]|uniref:Sec-independent protein translocase protein TatA n=1 Tax=Bradymonas sediminis TaxID=1548548 RepID=A0A2Z4FL42_9DELT|nr:twin-arginine translocase TatA/TatE family subunit [Bradymonas sediminis]AWV89721.1 twin-arginine translocase TatA/TatE family subunit [Bradymonas sediminis]TDP76537.1 sec-independent protein translocase protein TatA [Bradymonas sediminis]
MIGTPELVIILVIVLMLFGVGKLPQVAKMLGSGVKSFKDGINGKEEDEEPSVKKSEPELLEGDRVIDTKADERTKTSKMA